MIEYVDSRLPGEQAINKLYRNDKSIDGKADQGIFDINEIDNIYDRIGNRAYERNVELGNTLANYSNWVNVKEEAGYGIWKYPVSNFTDDDLNELYINNVKLDYVGTADSEDTPVGFTKVYTSNNKKSGPTYTDVTIEAGTLTGTPFTIGGITEYTVNVTPTTSGVALDYNNIIIGSVRVVTLASAPLYISYTENTDYAIDYVVGTITLLSGTSITGMVEMTYSVGDAIYIGLGTTFDSYSIGLAQRGVGNRFRPTYYKTAVGWEYFQPDIDTTSSFSSDGNFTFSGLTGWGTTDVNSQTLYWIKLDTLSQPLVYPTCNYIVESSSSVSKLLKLNMVDILQANYKWSYFSGYIYVNVPNNGASNQEGIGYLKSASSDDNKRNYFIYNNELKINYKNDTSADSIKSAGGGQFAKKLQVDDTSEDAIYSKGGIKADGGINWAGGNVIYVPIGASIQDAIGGATTGDTIILGAGTYTITSTITVNKKLHITGQGKGITTVTSATNQTSMFVIKTESDSLISNMTIETTAIDTTPSERCILFEIDGTVQDVMFKLSGSGSNVFGQAIRNGTSGAVVNAINCDMVATGEYEKGNHLVTCELGGIVNIYNCYAYSSNSTNERIIYSYGTVNIYNSFFEAVVTSGSTSSLGVVYCNGLVRLYNTTIKATGEGTVELKRFGGTLTVYNCTLGNNTTSGTITYEGTQRVNSLQSSGTIKSAGGGQFGGKLQVDDTASDAIYSKGGIKATTGTFSGILSVDNTTEATTTTDGSLQTDGGASVAKNLVVGGSVILPSSILVLNSNTAGTIAITKSFHQVDTFDGQATGELSTATGGTNGQMLILRPVSSVRDIVVKHNNALNGFCLAGGANFTMGTSVCTITFIHNGTAWMEISRSDSPI